MEAVLKITKVLYGEREHIKGALTSHVYWENVVTGEKRQEVMFGEPSWIAVTQSYFFGNPIGAEVAAIHGDLFIPVGKLKDESIELLAYLTSAKDEKTIEELPNVKVEIEETTLNPHRITAMTFLGFTDEELTTHSEIFS